MTDQPDANGDFMSEHDRPRIVGRISGSFGIWVNNRVEAVFKSANLIYADDLIDALQASPVYQAMVEDTKHKKVELLEAQLAEAKKDAGIE